jgi:hypothetical protein
MVLVSYLDDLEQLVLLLDVLKLQHLLMVMVVVYNLMVLEHE